MQFSICTRTSTQYVTNISGAHALASRARAGAPGAAASYLAFLKAGSSLYPLDALGPAGVDIESAGLVERLEQPLQRPA